MPILRNKSREPYVIEPAKENPIESRDGTRLLVFWKLISYCPKYIDEASCQEVHKLT